MRGDGHEGRRRREGEERERRVFVCVVSPCIFVAPSSIYVVSPCIYRSAVHLCRSAVHQRRLAVQFRRLQQCHDLAAPTSPRGTNKSYSTRRVTTAVYTPQRPIQTAAGVITADKTAAEVTEAAAAAGSHWGRCWNGTEFVQRGQNGANI